MRKVLVILAVLLTLPFSLRVRADDYFQSVPDSAIADTSDFGELTPEDIVELMELYPDWWGPEGIDPLDHLLPDPPDTLIVYYIDTVGWTIHEHRGPAFTTSTTGWDDGSITRIIDSLIPLIDTIIVGRFWTDADTKRIKDWKVMEAR